MDLEGFNAIQGVFDRSNVVVLPELSADQAVRFLSVAIYGAGSFFTAVNMTRLNHQVVLNRLDAAGFIENDQSVSRARSQDIPILRILGITKESILFEDLNYSAPS